MADDNVTQGRIVYDKSIINKIIDLAIRETDGVNDIVIDGKRHQKSKPGLKLEFNENEVTVDVSLIAELGCIVPEVACNIQRNIKTRVETTTEYKVKMVNINIVGVEV